MTQAAQKAAIPPDRIKAVFQAGLRWLIETVQPDGALIQHHGDGTHAGETPGTVIVRVNSGGNYLAAEQALIGHGFTVMPGPKPTYGCTLVVTHG